MASSGRGEECKLVADCLAGRESAYRDFVERYQGGIFRVCFRLLGDAHEAEDVVQEVFVRAIRGLSKWDSSRPLRPWLFTIAVNRCRTALAKSRRRPIPSELVDDVADPRAAGDSASELKAELARALANLRPAYREVFVLFHEQGLSYEEMSQVTGRPIGTLKTWLHRARGELLAQLRQKGFTSEVRHDLSGV